MSRKSMITIVVGLLLFAVALLASNLVFNAMLPSNAGIMASPQTQTERLQLAETIRTTFIFLAILDLLITGVLAWQWSKSGIPRPPDAADHPGSKTGSVSGIVQAAVITGIIAFAASYVSSMLKVFVFDIYGGLNPATFRCNGIPAGLFGILGGMIWYKIKRKSGFAPVDWIPLVIIGILAGLIPGACLMMLPQ